MADYSGDSADRRYGGHELPPPSDPMAVGRELIRWEYSVGDARSRLRRYRGSWMWWDGRRWVELEAQRITTAAYEFTEEAVYIVETKEGPEARPWSPTKHKIGDLIDALAAITYLDGGVQAPEWLSYTGLPPADELVPVANGLLHIHTRQLHPHTHELFNTSVVPFPYDPDAPTPEQWLEFLASLFSDDPESIQALQEFFGYVLSGRTDLQKILLIIGPTRAGKGVICTVLEHLIGRENCAGPTLASLTTNFGLQPLIGKTVAVVSDARLGGANARPVVERLLSVSGEDMLTIDRKYREPYTGTLSARLVIASNELPPFGDASGAIANRFVVLNLTKSWLGRENPRLKEELLSELPGIMNWSLDGLEALLMRGRFTEPQSSKDAILALQELVSPVSAFVRDRCTVGTGSVTHADLYAAYRAWTEDNGHRPSPIGIFGKDLRAVVPGIRTTRPAGTGAGTRERFYVGIALGSRPDGGDAASIRSTQSTQPTDVSQRAPSTATGSTNDAEQPGQPGPTVIPRTATDPFGLDDHEGTVERLAVALGATVVDEEAP